MQMFRLLNFWEVINSLQVFLPKIFFISSSSDILSNPIEYLKGVGPQRADLLKKELSIFTFRDLLEHFPFRHVDKTKINFINEINTANRIYTGDSVYWLIRKLLDSNRGKRLVAQIRDNTGFLELYGFRD